MAGKVNIRFNQLIYVMLCCYAFFIPMEKILGVLFDVDTILKPYRVLALLIIATFGIKTLFRWDESQSFRKDLSLYFIFVYGTVITLYRMMTEKFKMSYMYNDAFQLGLYLGVFVVMRHTKLGRDKLINIFLSLAAGVVVNALYAFYQFYFLHDFRRSAGFMDNPNYMAMSLVVVLLFMINYRSMLKGIFKNASWWITFLFLCNMFITAGSRTALAILSVGTILTLYFSSLKQKFVLFATALGILLFIGVNSSQLEVQAPLILLNRINKVSSEDDRIPIWKGVMKATYETNFVGIGVGQFKARFREFYQNENNDFVRRILERGYFASPHSDYLAILVIYGLPGLIGYLIFLFLSGTELLRRLRQTIDQENKLFYQLQFLTFLALVLFGFTAESFTSALFWILLGVGTRTELA